MGNIKPNGISLRSGRPRADLPVFGEYAYEWLSKGAGHYSEAYLASVASMVRRHLLPALGETPLNYISPETVESLKDYMSANLSGNGRQLSTSTVNHVLSVLRRIMEAASGEYGLSSPCMHVDRKRPEDAGPDPFTLQEVDLILCSVRPDFRHYYLTRFLTGLRTGEIDGLRWRFVDFDRGEILVRENLANGKRQTVARPARRDVRISGRVQQALLDQRMSSFRKSETVFCTRNGKPLIHGNVTRRVWYPLLDRLELRRRTPGQIRHTTALLWLAAGEAHEWIGRQLGLRSVGNLQAKYANFLPDAARRDGAASDLLLDAHGIGGLTR